MAVELLAMILKLVSELILFLILVLPWLTKADTKILLKMPKTSKLLFSLRSRIMERIPLQRWEGWIAALFFFLISMGYFSLDYYAFWSKGH